jgi:plastocyanin
VNGSGVLAVNAFHVAGSVLAAWAVLLAFLGLTRARFPGGDRGGRIVIVISLALVFAAVSSAVISASSEDEEGGEAKAGEPTAGEAPAGGQKLALRADPGGQLKFDKTSLEAKAGSVTIDLMNPASLPHNVTLEGSGIEEQEGKTVDKGGVSTVSAELKPGEYTYYCSVPGHRQGGMEGKLTVR